jgi:hypothetical protein
VPVRNQLTTLMNSFRQALAENNGLKPPLQNVLYRQVQNVVQNSSLLENTQLFKSSQKLVFHFLAFFSRPADE